MKRIDSLQGLRAFAFLIIFISHADIKLFSNRGGYGVSVFFVLSGFVMMYNYYGNNNVQTENPFRFGIRFAYSKIKKLYPLHVCMMLADIIRRILLATLHIKNMTFDLSLKIELNLFLLQSWFPQTEYAFSLNGVAWYLSVCTFHYFCFPFILKAFRKLKKFEVWVCAFGSLLVVILISITARRFCSSEDTSVFSINWITYICPAVRLFDFLIGCCLGYIFLNRITETPKHKLVYCFSEAVLIVLIIISFVICKKDLLPIGFSGTLLFILTSPALIWFTARDGGFLSKIMRKSPLVWLGNMSPYAFLMHQVIIGYCGLIIRNAYITAVVSFILTILMAYLWSLMAASKRPRANHQ